MLLRVIPMFCYGILRILEEIAKMKKTRKSGQKIGLLRCSIGNPRHGVDLRQSVGYPRLGEAEVPKWHPSGTPLRSSYYSQRAIFLDFCFQTPYIRTPLV